jgi:hypothetical protein
MKMLQDICGSNFLKEIGKMKYGMEKKWDEEGMIKGAMGG